MYDYPLKQRTIGRLLADKAKRIGGRTWLIYGEEKYSYAQAHDISNRYANGFADLGIPLIDIKTLGSASPREPDPELVHASDPQYIMYTSGTTGPSKGVISPHSQAHGVGRSLAQNYGYRGDDVVFTCLPLFHGN